MNNMSSKEKRVQEALGLLRDWIIPIEEYSAPPTQFTYFSDLPYVFVVVKAIDHAHAKQQVEQSGYFPEENFTVHGGWQSDIEGAYYRKIFRNRNNKYKNTNERKVIVL